MPPPAPSAPPRRRWWWGAALPAAVAAAIFLRTLRAGFTFDDRAAVQENLDVIDPGRAWQRLLRADFWGAPVHLTTSNKSYRPLTIAVFRLVRAASTPRGAAVRAAPFHALNVALHAGATAQVHAVALHLAQLESHVDAQLCATLAALLFALHPAHVEAVGGCVGAAELLCALLALGGLRAYAAAVALSARRCHAASAAQLAAALALAAAATLAKETGMTVLAAFVAYEWLHYATTNQAPLPPVADNAPAQSELIPAVKQQFSGNAKQRRKAAARFDAASAAAAGGDEQPAETSPAAVALRVMASVLAGVAYVAARRQLMGESVLVKSWRIVDNHLPFLPTRLSRGLSIAHAHWRFAYLLLFPAHLSADWGYACIPPVSQWRDPRNAGAAALYAAALAALLAAQPWRIAAPAPRLRAARVRLYHLAALGGAPLLPAANVVFFVGAFMAERLLYLPSVGYCMALAAPLARAARSPRRGARAAAWLVAAPLLGAYAARSAWRAPAWDSEAALFAAALHTCPRGAKMRVNAGVQARLRGDCAAAQRHFRVALDVLPEDYCEPYYGLGLCAVDDGRLGEAAEHFERAMGCLETADNAEDALRKTLSALHAAHPREPSILLAYGRLALRSGGPAAKDEACAAAGAAARILIEGGNAMGAAKAVELCPRGAAAAAKAGAVPPRGLLAGSGCDAASAAVLAEAAATGSDTARRAEIGTAFVQREGATCRGTKVYVEVVSALQNADPYNPHLHMEWARLLRTMAGRDSEAAAHADFGARMFEQLAASARRTPEGQAAARLAASARAEAASWEGIAAGPRSVQSLVNKPLTLQEL